jgi:hypothetical protein
MFAQYKHSETQILSRVEFKLLNDDIHLSELHIVRAEWEREVLNLRFRDYGKYYLLGCNAIVLLKLSDVSEERTVFIFGVK